MSTPAVRIAITRAAQGSYPRYGDWLRSVDAAVDLVVIEDAANPLDALCDVNGLLLPGGGDVHPDCFDSADTLDQCGNVRPQRDMREFLALAWALGRGLPVLGICRGLQLVNVALGGSLRVDLPREGIAGHGKIDGRDAAHAIVVDAGSRLHRIIGSDTGIVNSAHHQAADRIAPPLRVCARTDDGVVEALEWRDDTQASPLVLVQWHPERMDDASSPFSRAIAEHFLSCCHAYTA